MKKLLAGLTLLTSISSFACIESDFGRLCVGDKVVPNDENGSHTYTIKSVNPYTKKFQIYVGSYYTRKSIDELGVLEFCTDYSDEVRYEKY